MHVGIIPDGTRRWARERGASLLQAYAIGCARGIDIVLHLCDAGVECISVFALSNDNYKKRPSEEIEAVILQLTESMAIAAPKLLAGEIRIRFVGDIDRLLPEHRYKLRNIEAAVSGIRNARAEMNVLLNYSMGWDFSGPLEKHETQNIRDCDIIFRSGGVKRLSGFLPKQSAYAELFFTTKLWPDVTKAELDYVVKEFCKVNRSFGA